MLSRKLLTRHCIIFFPDQELNHLDFRIVSSSANLLLICFALCIDVFSASLCLSAPFRYLVPTGQALPRAMRRGPWRALPPPGAPWGARSLGHCPGEGRSGFHPLTRWSARSRRGDLPSVRPSPGGALGPRRAPAPARGATAPPGQILGPKREDG
jgi:hypothetical protein